MGNGSICVNTKEYLNERNNTLQYPSHSKEQQNLFTNSIGDYYNLTHPTNNIVYPNYYNNANFITINSRKWYKAAPKKGNSSPFTNHNNNFYIREKSFISEISQQDTKSKNLNTNNNVNKNNFIFLPFGDKYEGELYNNKPHGKGKYYSASGEIREGIFINGQLNGKGKMNL